MIESGRVAIVTGGGRGIGRAIAVRLAEEGAKVAISYRSNDASAEETAERARAAGVKCELFKGDVSSPEDVGALFTGVGDAFGRVDILVNNAGAMLLSKVEKGLSGQWRQMFEVNVLGLLYATDAAIGVMKRQQSGHIVNISSVAGIKPGGSSLPYAVSKAALIHLTKGLAVALAPEVRVNSVAPGFVDTRWHANSSDERKRQIADASPLKSLVSVESIATATLECLRNDNLTGQVIAVDSGSLLL